MQLELSVNKPIVRTTSNTKGGWDRVGKGRDAIDRKTGFKLESPMEDFAPR